MHVLPVIAGGQMQQIQLGTMALGRANSGESRHLHTHEIDIQIESAPLKATISGCKQLELAD